jgi:hypothetical protein
VLVGMGRLNARGPSVAARAGRLRYPAWLSGRPTPRPWCSVGVCRAPMCPEEGFAAAVPVNRRTPARPLRAAWMIGFMLGVVTSDGG